MSQKAFVLDTNVLLHDPHAMTRFPGHEVIIPVMVLEELDKMKRFTDELGKNARYVLRFLDDLAQIGDLHEGVKVEENIFVRVMVEVKPIERKSFPLSLEKNVNKILLASFHLKELGKDVSLLSKDFVMRVKARSIGLRAENYRSLKESYDNLYSGLHRMELPKREIDEFYKEGKLQVTGKDFFPNEYCLFTSKENSSGISKFVQSSGHLEPLLPLDKDVWGVKPLNIEQKCGIDLLLRDDVKLVTLIGKAGTGKTLLALACGMRKVFDEGVYKRIIVSRPIMPLGKDIGYLPGTKEEKLYHWMQPIYDNLEFLCESTAGEENIRDAKEWILDSEKIEMEAVTYIRGRSLPRAYIIIDEAQNLSPHEVKTIISRAGHGTKVILTGDPTQIDNPYLDKDSNALTYIVGKFKDQPIYGNMFFEKTERSELSAIAAEIL